MGTKRVGWARIRSLINENQNALQTRKKVIKSVTATASLVIGDSGKLIVLNAADAGSTAVTVTLPAATGSGAHYKIVVGTVSAMSAAYTVQVANADDTIDGQLTTASTGDTPDLAQPWVTAAASDTITLNGTTTGGVAIGDWIELTDIASNQWIVSGATTTSGAEATPFSAAVS